MSVATPEDDQLIRECLRGNPMQGKISITFETEPNFFDAILVQGHETKVMVSKTSEGELRGFGVMSKKPVFVNGKIQNIVGGSTAWQQKSELKTIIEAGGTFHFHNGSDGTFTGNVTKYKFKERGGIPNVYNSSIEFICGSSRS